MQNKNTQAILRIFHACAKPLTAVLDGIDDDHLYWKPAPESRSIGEIMRHLIRVDNWFLKRLGYKPQTEDPGEVAADRILEAMQRIYSQIESILAGCTRDTDLLRKNPARRQTSMNGWAKSSFTSASTTCTILRKRFTCVARKTVIGNRL